MVKGIDLPNKTVTFDKSFAPNPKRPKKLITDTQTIAVPAPAPAATKSKAAVSPASKTTTPKK